jgi:ketosteroid isomerase-like protein
MKARPTLGTVSPPLPDAPERTSLAFAEALNAGDLRAASSFFAREACLLTPDATVIRGREDIRAILVQLIVGRVQVLVEAQGMLAAGDMALSTERWTIRSNGGNAAPHIQTSSSTIVLRHLEGSWKLLVLAPWGWGSAITTVSS